MTLQSLFLLVIFLMLLFLLAYPLGFYLAAIGMGKPLRNLYEITLKNAQCSATTTGLFRGSDRTRLIAIWAPIVKIISYPFLSYFVLVEKIETPFIVLPGFHLRKG